MGVEILHDKREISKNDNSDGFFSSHVKLLVVVGKFSQN